MTPNARLIILTFVIAALVQSVFWVVDTQLQTAMDRVAVRNFEMANEAVNKLMTETVILPHLGDTLSGPDNQISQMDLYRLDVALREFLSGTFVVKVKVMDQSGVMIYSTDPAQIGQKYERSETFIHALRGRPTTAENYEDEVVTFSGRMFDLTVMGSYLPLRNQFGQTVGVAEVYSDFEQAQSFKAGVHRQVRALLMIVMASLFVVLVSLLWLGGGVWRKDA